MTIGSLDIYQMDQMGPGGSRAYAINTGHRAILGCFMCADNGQLAFRPLISHAAREGYVIVTSRPVNVRAQGEAEPTFHLLPTPFSCMAVPFYHQPRRNIGFNLGLAPNWAGQLTHLLGLMPDLTPDMPFSCHHQYGFASGARPQGWEQYGAHDVEPHGSTRVMWGRDMLREVSGEAGREQIAEMLAAHPITTDSFGLDMILHLSRVAAGSLPPDDQVLWDIWQRYAGEKDEVQQYHKGILALAA